MGKIKQYWLLTGLVMVALLGAGYFFGVKPQAAKVKSVKAETTTQAAANKDLRGEIQLLQKQAAGVIGQQNRLRQIAAILPNNPALPRLVRSLSTITEKSGVDLTSVAPGPLTGLKDADAPAALKSSTAAETEPKVEAEAAKPRRVVTPSSGLSEMPVTLVFTGEFSKIQLFLSKIETLDRAFVVDSLAVAPAADASAAGAAGAKKAINPLGVTIIGRVFVKTAAVAVAPIKTPAKSTDEK